MKISKNCSITTKRTLGVILDIVNIESNELYEAVKGNKNYSFMTSKSNIFNAKWRIYIDKHFAKN